MGETISLTTSDGHTLDAYKATPSGAVKGALVVVQEIFGINGQIRRTVDHFAEQGYVTIAPALFDRVEKGIELGYNETDFGIGRETRGKITDDWIIADVGAAVQNVTSAGKVSVIGFCFGSYAVLRRRNCRQGRRHAAEMPDTVPFRRQGCGHPARRSAEDQGRAAGQPNVRL